jgi:hypothetical protein
MSYFFIYSFVLGLINLELLFFLISYIQSYIYLVFVLIYCCSIILNYVECGQYLVDDMNNVEGIKYIDLFLF